VDTPFAAYQGNEPYVFVSYAHKDSSVVFPEIQWLNDQGFNIWYDEGISPGHEWHEELGERIAESSLFLYFITPQSVASEHCVREVNYAIDQKTQLLVVHLEPAELSHGLGMSLSSMQAIMRHELSDLDYRIKLLKGASDHIERGISVALTPAKSLVGENRKFAAVIGLICFLGGIASAALMRWDVLSVTPSRSLPVRKMIVDLAPVDAMAASGVEVMADGNGIVFVGDGGSGRQLFLRPLEQLVATPVLGTSGPENSIALSPDGVSVAFTQGNTLKTVHLDGGTPTEIAEFGFWPSWSDTGTIAFSGIGGLWQVPAVGGEPNPITVAEKNTRHDTPHYLPGGDSLLFTISRWGARERSQIALLSLESGEYEIILQGESPRLTTSGHLLFGRKGALWTTAFDIDNRKVMGEAVPVVEGLEFSFHEGPQYSISAEGSLVYLMASGQTLSELVWVDRKGQEEEIGAPTRWYQTPRLSPEGTQIATVIWNDDSSDLWTYSLDRQALARLTSEKASLNMPLWHPDGQRIVFSFEQSGNASNLFWTSADGSLAPEQLTFDDSYQFPTSWSSDGQVLVFYQWTSSNPGYDVAALTLEDEPSVEVILQNEYFKWHPALSPDGRWLAYASTESGRQEVYVRPFEDVYARRWPVSTDGGVYPRWSPDGGELFYMTETAMMAVKVASSPDFDPGIPKTLFGLEGYRHNTARDYDVSSDGRFVMLKTVSDRKTKLVWIQNFFDELERRVPLE
jgi:serine/threonine-protein kinase